MKVELRIVLPLSSIFIFVQWCLPTIFHAFLGKFRSAPSISIDVPLHPSNLRFAAGERCVLPRPTTFLLKNRMTRAKPSIFFICIPYGIYFLSDITCGLSFKPKVVYSRPSKIAGLALDFLPNRQSHLISPHFT